MNQIFYHESLFFGKWCSTLPACGQLHVTNRSSLIPSASPPTSPLVSDVALPVGGGIAHWNPPLWKGKPLENRRATNPLVRLVEEEEMWEAPDHPQGVLPQNRSATCMLLKATANDRRHLALCHDEIRGH
ncbi:uncharacterized protein TNCV_2000401 [Trichonephila clavipes]|nr:uncharacterized protein TNCV_2000401 [Trichonephila clavipes]